MSVDAAPGDTREPLVIEGLAGLRERVGTVLGVSDWVETTQENVNTFAKLTGDDQYIHVDPERAATGPFATTVQHGLLTLGTATGLLWSVCVVNGFKVILNYGLNKVRFPAPLKEGSRSRMHVELIEVNELIYNLPSHIPANFPVATGMAFAAKYRGEDRVSLAFCGDGSTSRADFHESLNMAGGLKLPCIFVIENNQFAYSTPVSMQTASHDFAGKAAAYGFPGVKVDGTNALAVYDAGQLVFSGGVTAPVPVAAGAVSHSSSVWG
ncbi:MAG TPA: thiamine pyrophosphate-dependent enzyme, partial [Mycobacterium sp.]|nr:thiamine pyrophosphate-dependent enzyme [Mycobacterium sp.]